VPFFDLQAFFDGVTMALTKAVKQHYERRLKAGAMGKSWGYLVDGVDFLRDLRWCRFP